MMVKAGDKANKTADYECQGCENTVHLNKGDTITACPCGCKEFDEVKQSASSQSSQSQHRK